MRVETFIAASDIAGPFNLNHTVHSGQTSEPEWQPLNNGYWDVELVNQRYVKYEVYSEGTPSSPRLRVAITSETVDDELCNATKKYLRALFRLDDNLEEFYRSFRGDPLVNAFSHLRGVEAYASFEPFRESNMLDLLPACFCQDVEPNGSVDKEDVRRTGGFSRWSCLLYIPKA